MFQMDEGIKANLDALAEAKAGQARLNEETLEAIDALYTEEIKAQLEAIQAEVQPKQVTYAELIKGLEELIKSDVVNYGATVKGTYLMATHFKGRVKWDTKALDGYSKGHPELLEFRSEGKPYASIRGI